jgi:K(+)-stimulated pyrophosphate-energized sodium pump
LKHAVSLAADQMFQECEDQIPKILQVKKKKGQNEQLSPEEKGWDEKLPDYDKCILMSTQASIQEMILPGAMVILGPLVAGLGFGKNACAGMLTGALVSSVQLAISMSNSGGAWDNAKKYIEPGAHGGKGSDAHKAAVVGDTVGDPFKDTAGPSLNILIKLISVVSLVIAPLI